MLCIKLIETHAYSDVEMTSLYSHPRRIEFEAMVSMQNVMHIHV